ncbi:UNVERIFIED_CONTAM: hypothetical protein Scaly_1750700 [Sesamum calycinum]|uniref:Uncharacterized protein n=3 Tax=Sesamum TaxID=4181 RepID=A0AAE1WML0_9LAMI|nr:hypothetical protein Sango_1456800 [Sesamum angolense]
MEGLIPFLYRAIIQYRNGGDGLTGTWASESPSASYMRLPGDSGRFSTSDMQLFRPADCGLSACSPTHRAAAKRVVQSPGQHQLVNSCRAVK